MPRSQVCGFLGPEAKLECARSDWGGPPHEPPPRAPSSVCLSLALPSANWGGCVGGDRVQGPFCSTTLCFSGAVRRRSARGRLLHLGLPGAPPRGRPEAARPACFGISEAFSRALVSLQPPFSVQSPGGFCRSGQQASCLLPAVAQAVRHLLAQGSPAASLGAGGVGFVPGLWGWASGDHGGAGRKLGRPSLPAPRPAGDQRLRAEGKWGSARLLLRETSWVELCKCKGKNGAGDPE